MSRHAYLVTAYNNFQQLRMLLELLDDERNDIYVHVDKKASDFSQDYIIEGRKWKSQLFFIGRENNYWGDISFTKTIFRLIRCAYNTGGYSYYHLISGSDLPLKSQNEIHEFFDVHPYEFVRFSTKEFTEKANYRYRYFHFLVKWQSERNPLKRLLYYCTRIIVKLEMCIGIDRDKKLKAMYGNTWFSVTEECVGYLLSREKEALKRFCNTTIPDESWIHSLIFDSVYRDRLYVQIDEQMEKENTMSNLRYIVWKSSKFHPETWTMKDYDELMHSGCLFARKFDLSADKDIVDAIYSELGK